METLENLQSSMDSLMGMLDQVIAEQGGEGVVGPLRLIRQLALERRAGRPQAGQRLVQLIKSLPEEGLRSIIRAIILYFDLANLAEDLHRLKVLAERGTQTGGAPQHESIPAAIRSIKEHFGSSQALQKLIHELCIEPVFTAHPTEAKRRTTRRVLKHLRESVLHLQSGGSSAVDRQESRESVLSDLTVLWQIDPIRPKRPTVLDEVERGLLFCQSLWDVIPALYQQMRQTVAAEFAGEKVDVPAFIRVGSWIGGDRDGNPFVTSEVTAKTLDLLRSSALKHHLAKCQELAQTLVMSDQIPQSSNAFAVAVDRRMESHASLSEEVSTISEKEPYRRWLKLIELRILNSLATSERSKAEDVSDYSAAELLCDAQQLADSLNASKGGRIVESYVRPWIDQIKTFGLHFAALDIRQDSRTHRLVISDIFRLLGVIEDFSAARHEEQLAILQQESKVGIELLQMPLSDDSRELLTLFQSMAQLYQRNERERLGSYIVSMTNNAADLLIVLWLWKWAWRTCSQEKLPVLSIVPLFETIADLVNGPSILESLLQIEVYREYLSSESFQPTQMVMVGYSDSTKDGGYLSASWSLFRAQERLTEVAEKHHVRLTFFHGRGGALGRGGGPAARAILSLPTQCVRGTMRITEQGEIIAERYDDPKIAFRHLEQITWATLQTSLNVARSIPESWRQIMDQLADSSLQEYRGLINLPGFMTYFDQATPISFIERLPLGSRPSRRRERKSLADLRAIPWTFSWTQNRHLIPAWFGLGSALSKYVSLSGGWSELQAMYDQWPFFQALINNAELAIAKADQQISRLYSALATDAACETVWNRIDTEFQETHAAILLVTRQATLLEKTGWLQRTIQQRNPYVDPLNFIQIELIERIRRSGNDDEDANIKREELVRLTIQGIAAGLRNTG